MKKNLKHLRIFENFKEKSIPDIIKKISRIIRSDIKINGNANFNKNYDVDGMNLNIVVDFRLDQKQPY